MRLLFVLVMSQLGACAAFDEMMMPDGSTQPAKIYLGNSVVTVLARDVDDYGCLGSVMICERFGSKMRCRC